MTQVTDQDRMDFDIWMNMAKDDPRQFESKRMEAIDEVIESAPAERQMQLRRLQWRIDMTRERAGSPMAATIAISKMMWDAFYNLKEHYAELYAENETPRRARVPLESAQVIEFRPQLVEA